MPKWEIKRLFIPTDAEFLPGQNKDLNWNVINPAWGEKFSKKWADAEALADAGWELVGIAPETKGYTETWVPVPANKCYGLGTSYTAGYILVFKRQVS